MKADSLPMGALNPDGLGYHTAGNVRFPGPSS